VNLVHGHRVQGGKVAEEHQRLTEEAAGGLRAVAMDTRALGLMPSKLEVGNVDAPAIMGALYPRRRSKFFE
jgi:hypothetical protein